MSFTLPPLPYELNDLEPYISKETLEYHYGKHHQAYVNNLNNLIPETEFADMSLEDIIWDVRDEFPYVFNTEDLINSISKFKSLINGIECI